MKLGIYVHTPFCPTKCGYCDFNSYAMSGEIMERFTHACEAEIRASPNVGKAADTVFFGGGTPTYLEASQLVRLLQAVRESFNVKADAEISSEANPGTADAEKFAVMREAGFNRLSIGAQSFLDKDLIRLERVHKADEIDCAISLARQAGFENFNLDLMFALPTQTAGRWRDNVRRALSYGSPHLSLYCLTIEPQTRFDKLFRRGELALPEDELQIKMQRIAIEECSAAGLRQYEISNFAAPGMECRHNMIYWHNEEYLGFGPGAASFVGGVRSLNVKHPEKYIEAVMAGVTTTADWESLTGDHAAAETLMLGLRLTEGVTMDRLEDRHPGAFERFQPVFREMERRGWLTVDSERVSLTDSGRFYHNEIAMALLP